MSESKRVIDLYGELLDTVADRLEAARNFLATDATWPNARAAASELRGVLEQLLYAGLLGHRHLLPEADEALARLDRKSARRLVKKTNADWWPMPVTSLSGPGVFRIESRVGADWLREDEWDAFYSRTSSVMHVRNPFVRDGPDLVNTIAWLEDLNDKVRNLLAEHMVRPTPQAMLLARLDMQNAGERVRVDRWTEV